MFFVSFIPPFSCLFALKTTEERQEMGREDPTGVLQDAQNNGKNNPFVALVATKLKCIHAGGQREVLIYTFFWVSTSEDTELITHCHNKSCFSVPT